MRRGVLALLAGIVLPVALWTALPLGSQAQQASVSSLQHKIQVLQGKVGRKKGTEHVLTSDIAAWSGKINHLQGKITSLAQREAFVQADLSAKQAELSRL